MSSYGNYPQQPGYGQQPPGPPGYGQPQGYQQPYGYGRPPSRPAAVTTAAVFGFILGALAVLSAIGLFVGTSFFVGVNDAGTGLANALAGVFIVIALLFLIIAVLLIWGSVLAVSGRSRVLLIVGASLVAAFGLIGFVGSLGDSTQTDTGGIILQLILTLVAILIVVLISLAPAGQYFAAQRARRGR